MPHVMASFEIKPMNLTRHIYNRHLHAWCLETMGAAQTFPATSHHQELLFFGDLSMAPLLSKVKRSRGSQRWPPVAAMNSADAPRVDWKKATKIPLLLTHKISMSGMKFVYSCHKNDADANIIVVDYTQKNTKTRQNRRYTVGDECPLKTKVCT